MLEKLIRPVVSEYNAELSNTTTVFGRVFKFPGSLKPELDIDITNSFLLIEAVVNIHEINQGRETILLISPFFFYSNPDFVQAQAISRVGKSAVGSEKEVLRLDRQDPISRAYSIESPIPNKLYLVKGADYDLVIGQKPESIFVDGWLKEAQIPKWRLSIPLDQRVKLHPDLLVPSSKLLLFE